MSTHERKYERLERAVGEVPAAEHACHRYVPLTQGETAPFDVRFSRFHHQDHQLGGEKPIELHFAWASALAHSPKLLAEYYAHRREYRSAMGEILQLVGVTDPSQIVTALTDDRTIARRRVDANRAIGRLYGADETGRRVVKEHRRARTVAEYAKSANDYIENLRFGVLNPVAWKIRPSEESIAREHPLDLLELVFVPGYDPKLGFEGLRKLFLMTKIAAVDYRSTELAEGDSYQRFTDMLDERFWDQDRLRGQTDQVVLLSAHSLADYSVMNPDELKKLTNGRLEPISEIPTDKVADLAEQVKKHNPERRGYHLRLTTLPSRRFTQGREAVFAFIDKRLKPFHSRVTKMLRKGEEDPSVAVEDKIGMMVVVKNRESVDMFLQHLQETGIKSGSVLRIEGMEDTLSGQQYSAKNVGSSRDVRMLKFYARVHGTRIEVIVHTYETYLEYMFHDDRGHDEVEIKRFFDTGLYELLFPPSLYPDVNVEEDRRFLLQERFNTKRINRIG